MSLLNEFEEASNIYSKFKEGFYAVTDIPGMPEEIFFRGEPDLSNELYRELLEKLYFIEDVLNSEFIKKVIENFTEDSALFNYINFDEENYQNEYIQEHSDGDEEKLGGVQNDSANASSTERQRLWDEGKEDIQYLVEQLLPELFS